MTRRLNRQTAVHRRYLGLSLSGGTPQYAAAVTIAVYKEVAKGKRYSATGTEINTETYYRTATEIKVSDQLDGVSVRRVESYPTRRSPGLVYEAFV